MSYAHEIFGVRETRHDIWMQDLLLAGTSSATFNSDRMLEIASSPFVKDNGWAGFYLILWCKYNNVPLNEVLRVGQKVAIRNSDYGTVDNYILIRILSGKATFVSENFIGYMPTLSSAATHYDGIAANTFCGAWLQAETPNWFDKTTMVGNTHKLIEEYGYSHGISEEFKEILSQNAVAYERCVNPYINDNPKDLYEYTKLGMVNAPGATGIYSARLCGLTPLSAARGKKAWALVLPTSSTSGNAVPLAAPFWSYTMEHFADITAVNAGTQSNEPTIIDNVYAKSVLDGSTALYGQIPSMKGFTGIISTFVIDL